MDTYYSLRRQRSGLAPLHKRGVCDNCETPLQGPVCHECGQHETELHRPIPRLIKDGLSDSFALDGRVMRSLPMLMLKPGMMTRLYLKGARARFMPPFRLYIITSLIFFFFAPFAGNVSAFLDAGQPQSAPVTLAPAPWEEGGQPLGTLSESTKGVSASARYTNSQGEQLDVSNEDQAVAAALDFFLGDEEEKVNAQPSLDRAARYYMFNRVEHLIHSPDSLMRETFRWASRMAFAMVPIVALFFATIYAWRQGFYYFDHLITAIHLQSALFLAATLSVWLGFILPPSLLVIIFMIYAWYYLYRVQREVYTSGRVMGHVRTFVIYISYSMILGMSVLIAFIFGVITA